VTKHVRNRPRLIMAGLSGGAGKTILTLGLCRAWVRQGHDVQPFKKGPDYIDATWLGLAARSEASNLDPFLMPSETLRSLFWHRMQDRGLGLVEGNRGLFDGKDVAGSCSTAELARQLRIPLVLVLDCTKMTRTAAALVKGVRDFEPGLPLAGVILNRTAGERHRDMLRRCLDEYTGVPVLGAVPKIPDNPIPERHMGLISNQEYQGHEAVLDSLADLAEEHLDLDGLMAVARAAPEPGPEPPSLWTEQGAEQDPAGPVRIGYVRDAALWFYYRENLEALAHAGAELVELSLLQDTAWPELHGLYLGGGFPETLAHELANNGKVRQRVRTLAELGLPIYAECGGFMYLAHSLTFQKREYPMAGVFPVRTELYEKPQGLGYTEAEVVAPSVFHQAGAQLVGHEFHYSKCHPHDEAELTLALRVTRGQGMLAGHDGLLYKNTFATYFHIHALGVPHWAGAFAAAAREYRDALEQA
jgi:cobyrinic acid a,c-diamide synthase